MFSVIYYYILCDIRTDSLGWMENISSSSLEPFTSEVNFTDFLGDIDRILDFDFLSILEIVTETEDVLPCSTSMTSRFNNDELLNTLRLSNNFWRNRASSPSRKWKRIERRQFLSNKSLDNFHITFFSNAASVLHTLIDSPC